MNHFLKSLTNIQVTLNLNKAIEVKLMHKKLERLIAYPVLFLSSFFPTLIKSFMKNQCRFLMYFA